MKKLLYLIIILIIIVIALGIYAVTQKTSEDTESITTTKDYDASFGQQDDVMDINVNMSGQVTNTESCGTADCFEEKFSNCLPATMESTVEFGSFYYKIIGPESNGCKVTMKYTKNPNPEWVNKEITCILDNELELEESVIDAFNRISSGNSTCSGPLYDMLTSY
jgi:hypothetical protein